MLHQEGSRAAWLRERPALNLIVTMDDATGMIYSAFLVDEEGTLSTLRALLECSAPLHRSFCAPQGGKAVDKDRLTQVRREFERLGVEHIAAYRRISELGAC
jgi:hypothetical protein